MRVRGHREREREGESVSVCVSVCVRERERDLLSSICTSLFSGEGSADGDNLRMGRYTNGERYSRERERERK